MSDQADSIPQDSFPTIEQAIKQANLKFWTEFLRLTSSSAQAQNSKYSKFNFAFDLLTNENEWHILQPIFWFDFKPWES